MALLQRFAQSIAFYPLTVCYLGGVGILMLTAADRIETGAGVLALTLLAVAMMLASMYREVRLVHLLVNSQHDQMAERIDQLIAALVAADISVPPAADNERDARREATT